MGLLYNRYFRKIADHYVPDEEDNEPPEIVCDDSILYNMKINNTVECKIVGWYDLDWMYLGPRRLAECAFVRGLLMEMPLNWNGTGHNDDAISSIYDGKFELYMQVLEDEESKTLDAPCEEDRPSRRLRQIQQCETIWFYNLMFEGSSCGYDINWRRFLKDTKSSRPAMGDWPEDWVRDAEITAEHIREESALDKDRIVKAKQYHKEQLQNNPRWREWMRLLDLSG